jgi:hypothetical protein
MKPRHFLAFLLISLPLHADPALDRSSVIIATGAGGEETYATAFARWTESWQKAANTAGAHIVNIPSTEMNARDRLRQTLEMEAKEATAPLWIVLLGHGSYGGGEAKFNLPGDDLSATELAAWLQPFQRPVVVVCGFSASGAFLKPLSAPGRIVVTATRSGAENNYARHGGYFAESIANPSADLDKDGQTSVLEAWLAAAQRTADFYKGEERLATEHSLLDDNGDGLGTPADWFQGVRVVKKSSDQRAPDGLHAHQMHLVPSAAERALFPALRKERNQLEQEIAQLRETKATLPQDEYYSRLEALLLRLAQLYRESNADAPPQP